MSRRQSKRRFDPANAASGRRGRPLENHKAEPGTAANNIIEIAGIAQLVEHIIRNDGVRCSNHLTGTKSAVASTLPRNPARSSLSAFGLIAGNTGLLFLYLGYDLTLYQLVLIYWLECFFIGVFSAVKLLLASVIGDPYRNTIAGVSRGVNVVLSVMAIMLLGSTFLMLVAGMGVAIFTIPTALADVDVPELFMQSAAAIILGGILLAIGHCLSFIVNFLVMGEYRDARAGQLIGWPFFRCFSLLGAIIVAFGVAALVPQLASARGFAAALIVLKLVTDVWLHLAERRAFASK